MCPWHHAPAFVSSTPLPGFLSPRLTADASRPKPHDLVPRVTANDVTHLSGRSETEDMAPVCVVSTIVAATGV